MMPTTIEYTSARTIADIIQITDATSIIHDAIFCNNAAGSFFIMLPLLRQIPSVFIHVLIAFVFYKFYDMTDNQNGESKTDKNVTDFDIASQEIGNGFDNRDYPNYKFDNGVYDIFCGRITFYHLYDSL
jgi:hypothetical protein